MSKNRKRLDPFPREVFVQRYKDINSEEAVAGGSEPVDTWLNVYPTEADCFDHDPGNAGAPEATRVAVYRLVEIVTLTRKETITRRKRKERT